MQCFPLFASTIGLGELALRITATLESPAALLGFITVLLTLVLAKLLFVLVRRPPPPPAVVVVPKEESPKEQKRSGRRPKRH